jgi:hypothetical protein
MPVRRVAAKRHHREPMEAALQHRQEETATLDSANRAMLMVQGYDRPALQKCKRLWEQCAAGFLACRNGLQRQSNTQRLAPVECRQ